jgi:hypothetical protein
LAKEEEEEERRRRNLDGAKNVSTLIATQQIRRRLVSRRGCALLCT